ncbi:GtrA family protein|uniref:GtrA family protein n=1 Tax=Noviherbaspirillum sp. L7-7A TaxID=2850560 RepID=UPI001C2C1F3F|nr:GtrA family protein [Noviherbaspirillum sp. L7-7A]MBV0878429.1 GtrA family protein [Noviherbaspirillum sp. L7-7A]
MNTRPSSGNISLRSLATFLVVGGFATGLQYAIMALLMALAGVPALAASNTGFAISAVANYLLNAKLTFRSERSHASTLPRFAVTAALGLGINSLLLSLLIAAGLHPAPAQILSTAGVLIWNYTLNALWTFKKPQT